MHTGGGRFGPPPWGAYHLTHTCSLLRPGQLRTLPRTCSGLILNAEGGGLGPYPARQEPPRIAEALVGARVTTTTTAIAANTKIRPRFSIGLFSQMLVLIPNVASYSPVPPRHATTNTHPTPRPASQKSRPYCNSNAYRRPPVPAPIPLTRSSGYRGRGVCAAATVGAAKSCQLSEDCGHRTGSVAPGPQRHVARNGCRVLSEHS